MQARNIHLHEGRITMESLALLLHELFTEAYLRGREDGLEGLYIEPQLVLLNYLTDNHLSSKVVELGQLLSDTFSTQSSRLP